MAGVLTSESEFSEEMMDIRKDFVAIHGEMVLLKNYSSLNFAGIAVLSLISLFLSLIWVSNVMGRWFFPKIIVLEALIHFRT